MPVRYVGSGPYCYANSLAMVLHPDAPDPSLIEVLTGSPFGANITRGMPFFDPLGWDPDAGLDAAVAALGWRCRRVAGGTVAAAVDRLRAASAEQPVLAGPLRTGRLWRRPVNNRPMGTDHFVVVMGIDDRRVVFHDPHGYPFATLPLDEFVTAWRADTVPYAEPFTMRYAFTKVHDVHPYEALRRSLAAAAHWLEPAPDAPAASALSGAAALRLLADWVEAGLSDDTHRHLVGYAVRVGLRRLADASFWLTEIGQLSAAEVADRQARLVGAVRYALLSGDRTAAAAALRLLAPTYDQMHAALRDAA